jgi:CUB domain
MALGSANNLGDASGLHLQVVTLDFDYFSTETDADFVYVYNGGQETDPLIVKLHGSYSTLPQGYTTTQKLMLVRFTSDSSVHIGGFRANYKSLTSGTCNLPM